MEQELDAKSLFVSFYRAVAGMEPHPVYNSAWAKELTRTLDRLDPVAKDKHLADLIEQHAFDEPLVELYQIIHHQQTSSLGDGYYYSPDKPEVLLLHSLLKEHSGSLQPTESDLQRFQSKVYAAVEAAEKRDFLLQLRARLAPELQEYRLGQLEKTAAAAREGGEEGHLGIHLAARTKDQYTNTQQLLALQYLLGYALAVDGADDTKALDLAHLLSAKSVPSDPKSGAPKMNNSPLKSALSNAKTRATRRQLSDLRFVYRIFSPLATAEAEGMQRAVAAIVEEIDRLERRLEKRSRTKD